MKAKISDLAGRKVKSPNRAGLIKRQIIKAAVTKVKRDREEKMKICWKGFRKESISYVNPVGFWGWFKFWVKYPVAYYKFNRSDNG